MNWKDVAQELLEIVGGFAALLNIAGILGLIFIKAQYKKMLARHEHELSVQLAGFESSLESARHDHSVAFSRLYERREAVLGELWKHLVHARRMAHNAFAVSQRCDLNQFLQVTQLAKEELEKVEFYFPNEFCEQWYNALHNLENAVLGVIQARELRSPDWDEDRKMLKASVDEFVRVWNSTKGPLVRRIQQLIKIEELG